MRKSKDNPLVLSSKKPCQSQTDSRRELVRLRSDLELEKSQTQQAHGHLRVELRLLREEAEKEQQRALRELTARRGCQWDRHSNKHRRALADKVNIKDCAQYSKTKSTRKEGLCLCTEDTYTKLDLLLLTLYEKINGEQGVCKQHHRQNFELEKAIFLCHLLKAYGRLLQGRQRELPSYIFKRLSRKPTQEEGKASCQTLQRSHSAAHSTKKNNKQDQQKQPSDRPSGAADPCTTAAVVDTCWSGSREICHPRSTPHAGWGDRPTCCAESFGSDESPPTKCLDRNMEVSRFMFQNKFSSLYVTCCTYVFEHSDFRSNESF